MVKEELLMALNEGAAVAPVAVNFRSHKYPIGDIWADDWERLVLQITNAFTNGPYAPAGLVRSKIKDVDTGRTSSGTLVVVGVTKVQYLQQFHPHTPLDENTIAPTKETYELEGCFNLTGLCFDLKLSSHAVQTRPERKDSA